MRDPSLGRLRNAFGFLLHTTGGGITPKAMREHKTPLDVAIEVYRASQNGSNGYTWGGPSYVIDHAGGIYQLAPDDVMTAHCGSRSEKFPHGTRELYLSGEWTKHASDQAVAEWRAKWTPPFVHCYSLFPSRDPNIDYVGCEMIPIGDGFGGEPMAPGLRFTKAQHDAAIALGRDLGARHGWPTGWSSSSRLLGHEDVDLLNRCDATGGWDPGFLRPAPYFDFGYVREQLGKTA